MRKKAAIIWFRDNLRISDNHLLSSASREFDKIVPVFIFDDTDWERDEYGNIKTNVYRTKFLLECVENLRVNLKKLGSNLVVRMGNPPEILTQLAQEYEVDLILGSRGITPRQIATDKQLALKTGALYRRKYVSNLFDSELLPFNPLTKMPEIFTSFRKKVEAHCHVHEPVQSQERLTSAPFKDVGEIPSLSHFGFQEPAKDKRSAFDWKGGEDAAQERLKHYVLESRSVVNFFFKRNRFEGNNISTKLSAYLSTGCLSPNEVWYAVNKLENHKKDRNSYWIKLLLLQREYSRALALVKGEELFSASGFSNEEKEWKRDETLEKRWKEGRTGIPLVDANMREIAATGYMSSKGREVVASYLTHDLGIDWRVGAAWFRSLLIDYDVYNNYANWSRVAQVGHTRTKSQYVNPVSTITEHKGTVEYIKKWVPELSDVSDDELIRWPMLSKAQRKKAASNFPDPIKLGDWD